MSGLYKQHCIASHYWLSANCSQAEKILRNQENLAREREKMQKTE